MGTEGVAVGGEVGEVVAGKRKIGADLVNFLLLLLIVDQREDGEAGDDEGHENDDYWGGQGGDPRRTAGKTANCRGGEDIGAVRSPTRGCGGECADSGGRRGQGGGETRAKGGSKDGRGHRTNSQTNAPLRTQGDGGVNKHRSIVGILRGAPLEGVLEAIGFEIIRIWRERTKNSRIADGIAEWGGIPIELVDLGDVGIRAKGAGIYLELVEVLQSLFAQEDFVGLDALLEPAVETRLVGGTVGRWRHDDVEHFGVDDGADGRAEILAAELVDLGAFR